MSKKLDPDATQVPTELMTRIAELQSLVSQLIEALLAARPFVEDHHSPAADPVQNKMDDVLLYTKQRGYW